MKTRLRQTARPFSTHRRFALRPLAFAICVGLSGAALALPQGGKVVSGNATIGKPDPNTEVIKQTTDKAIIDWLSFSIGAGEKVRFYQPSTTSVTLNRVTGYDPSSILGQMSSNGRIFLINPNGVVFGAGARIDVGGIVVSTLSLANNDFLASRYSLTSIDPDAPAQRGAIRNEGTISAPGGIVVLAGPNVSNTGTIIANGGRVGLVAANAVSVDVEGDGLLFFQTSASEAKNRLEQLGRIQADGGTIEMRAAARGAFADTVLNMAGVVQAKTIGTREGRIVIDGGDSGITSVSGQIDATGLARAEHGGAVTVTGERVALVDGAGIDASGSAGGGAVRIGGDFHGANPLVRNAEYTGVAPTAVVRANAIDNGDGGTVAIWSDNTTRYYGTISAEGGKLGGNGGFVEVSGKANLVFRGDVSTLAPMGQRGTLLLDPTDITIADAAVGLPNDVQLDANVPAGQLIGVINAADAPAVMTISSAKLETVAAANSIDLQASNSITINALVTNVATANTLTLNTGGGSAKFETGNGGFSMASNNTIKVTNGSLVIDATAFGAGPVSVGSLTASGAITVKGSAVTLNGPVSVTAAGAGVSVTGPTTLAAGSGAITLTGNNAANDVTLGTVNGAQALNITATGGDIVIGTVGAGPALTSVTLVSNTANLGAVTTTGAQNYAGVTGTVQLTVGGGNITGNGVGTTLVADPAGSTFNVNNPDKGTVGAQAFTAVGNLKGAAGPDNFIIAAGGSLAGAIDGGLGVNSLDLSARGTADFGLASASSGTASGVTGGYSNVTTLIGNPAKTTLTGTNTGSTFTVNGANSGTVFDGVGTTTFSGVKNLTGGTGADSFVVTPIGSLAGTIDGGAVGANSLTATAGAAENLTLSNAQLARSVAGNIALANIGSATLTGGAGNNTIDGTGWTGGRTLTVNATAGADTVNGNGINTTLVATNAASNFTVSGNNSGTLVEGGNTTTFATVGNLTGGTANDNFAITGTAVLSGNIVGGGGAVNTLDLSGYTNPVTFNIPAGTSTGVGGTFSGISNVVGSPANTTVTGSAGGSVFNVTGANAGDIGGVAFSGAGNLLGGAGPDNFVIAAGGSLVGNINGGGGVNSLNLSALAAANFTLRAPRRARPAASPAATATSPR